MFDLSSLGTIVGDPELRAMLKDLTVRKINSDIKTVQAHSELSRHLLRARRDDAASNAELKSVLREHLEYYGAVVEMSQRFHERLLDQLQKGTMPGKPADRLTLNITARRGALVRAPFKIANSRAEPISISCSASPFVSEKGDHLVASAISFDPPRRDIAPKSETVFEAVLPVSEDFEPGKTYFATLTADGVEAMSILLRLTVEESLTRNEVPVAVAATASVQITPAPAPEAASPGTARRSRAKPAAPAKAVSPAKPVAKSAAKSGSGAKPRARRVSGPATNGADTSRSE
jgi:hypothetical protein